MILDDSMLSAIARIEVYEPGGQEVVNRGTAFLVDASGTVLTARHAVLLPGEASFTRARDRVVELTFGGTKAFETKATVVQCGSSLDYAILKCSDKVPAGLHPIPLHPVPLGRGRLPWSTYGYPDVDGCPVDGVLRIVGPAAVDAYAEGYEGKSAKLVDGLSGSPCLVGGGAVGLIARTLTEYGTVLRGTLLVVPATAVAEDAKGSLRLALPQGVTFPYERHFQAAMQDRLKRAGLDDLAVYLRITPFEPFGDDELARYVTRAMLSRGARAAGAILSCGALLGDALARELFDLSLTLWVDGEAAQQLGQAVSDGKHSAINATRTETGLDYVRRACFAIKCGGVPHWQKRCVQVMPEKKLPLIDHLLESIARALQDKNIRVPLRPAAEPAIVLLREEPRQEIVEAVAKKFPGVRLLFLARASKAEDMRRESLSLEYIVPELGEGDEERAFEEREDAQEIWGS